MSDGGKHAAERRTSGGTRPAAERVLPKLKVGDARDPMEREAEAVAQQVAAGQPAATVSRMAAPEKKPEPVRRAAASEKKEEPVRRAAAPKEKKEEPVRRAAAPEEKKEEPIRRAAAPEEKKEEAEAPEDVQRQEDEREEEVQAKSREGSTSEAMSSAAQHAVDTRGPGTPLDAGVRSRIESSTGADLGHVRVHDDQHAHAAADKLNARAFTHGSDIWMGPSESASDVRLMAHEAAHVLQQGGGRAQRLVQRTNGTPAAGAPAGAPAGGGAAFEIDQFPLPPIKSRHRPVYASWAASNALKRAAGYSRDAEGDPGQRAKWKSQVALPPADLLSRLHIDLDNPAPKDLDLRGKTVRLPGTREELQERLKLPNWDRTGEQPVSFDVDHIVELQVAGWPQASTGNELENMELLDRRSNASAGGATRFAIRDSVRDRLQRERSSDPNAAPVTTAEVQNVLNTRPVVFRGVTPGSRGRRPESMSKTWSRAEIEQGEHLARATPLANVGEVGRANRFALVSPARTRVLAEYAHPAAQTTFAVTAPVQQRRVPGLLINQVVLNANYTEAAENDQIGTAHATWDLPPQIQPQEAPVEIPLHRHSQYGGYLGQLPSVVPANATVLSPIEFTDMHVETAGIAATGRLTPTIPLIEDTPLELRLLGRDIELAYSYSPGEISIPIPGVTIDDTSLAIFFGTRGFGAEGMVDFTIARVGDGRLTATLTTERGFEASGRFSFDTRLFDEATAEVWYRERAFGGRGTLRITNPEKIRGIRSAEVTVTFSQTEIGATGTVVPSIPGIENATLTVEYSEEEGLLIGGTINLGEGVPGIRSGTIEAQVRKRPEAEEYSVTASGTARPAIPGIDTTLTISYADGALTIEGSADYSRGLLSGSVQLGATNRVLDATGTPTDEVGPDLRVYGGGQLTVRLTPWLQGTVGVRFLPNGELELTGAIALPDVLEIFPEKRFDRNIFSINIDIPILGFAVAGQRIGIFATIGGGLDLSAGIGPGQLRDLGIRITYNPDHEDQTHIEGGAKLVIPAQAGLRLYIRGALGAGIPIVSATLGLEVGGRLGLEGAVEASVEVDWTPSTGLVLDALGEIYVQPKFRFDLTGFLEVEADLLLTTIELYEKRWELAAFELGPDLRFGVRFPIHYEEGQPFDISLDDLEFEVPDVDTNALIGDLVDQIV